jgi:hypothetical protein
MAKLRKDGQPKLTGLHSKGRAKLADGFARLRTHVTLSPEIKKWLLLESKRSGKSQPRIIEDALIKAHRIKMESDKNAPTRPEI